MPEMTTYLLYQLSDNHSPIEVMKVTCTLKYHLPDTNSRNFDDSHSNVGINKENILMLQ